LEDKVDTKLVPWIGKHFTIVGHATHVKSILTSIDIYYITVLNIPIEVLMYIYIIRRLSFGWRVTRSLGGNAKLI
jgi:hypothetical protein